MNAPDPIRNPGKGLAYALAGNLALAIGFICAKISLAAFDPVTFSLVWTATATLLALGCLLPGGGWKELRLPGRLRLRAVLIGAATGAGMIWGWSGLQVLDPSLAAFFGRFETLLIILMGGLFLSERFQRREAAPVALMIAGGLLSAAGGGGRASLGILLILLAGLATAFQHLLAKGGLDRVSPRAMLAYRNGLAFLAVLLWSLSAGPLDFQVPGGYWLAAVIGAGFAPFLGFLLIFHSYRHWELSRTGVILNTQPLLVIPASFMVFGSLPGRLAMAGGLVILAGAFWLARIHRQAERGGRAGV